MKTDALLYRLLQDHPGLVFELAGLPTPETPYELRAEEIKETQFRFDGLLIPPVVAEATPLVFLENQFQPDDDFYARWFASIFLYLRRHPERRWWRAVVLFPERRIDVGKPRGFEDLLAGNRVSRIYLDEGVTTQPKSPALGLIGLLLAEPGQAVAAARSLLAEAAPVWPDFNAWVETLLVYKLPRFSREEIKAMVHLIDVDIRDTRYYEEVAADVQARMVTRQLRKRLGEVASSQEAMIRALPVDQLEALGDALLDFSGPDDFIRWLAQHVAH